ncbi:MAG: hypothetical protein ACMG50_05360 [Thermomonas sp.]
MKIHSLHSLRTVMPLHTHWDSQQLADAVPLRLSQLLDFSADTLRACDRASANAEALRGTKRSTTFLPPQSLTPFRTR